MLNRYSFFRRAAFALLSMPLLASLAFAQITNVTNDTSTPIPGAGHDYVKLLSETVNPANGSVSIRIQVPVPEGRGITIPFSFAYDSNGVQHLAMTSNALWWETNGSFMSNGGWSYAVPMLTFSPGSTTYTVPGPPPQSQIVCGYTSDFVFQNPSGERHGLYIATVNGADHPKCDSSPYVPQAVPSAGDDVYRASFTPACGDSCGAVNPVTVTDADGTNFYFSNSTPDFLHASVGDFPGHSSLPDYVQDRNGNKVIFTDLNLTQGQPLGAFNATDLDNTRTVVSATGFGNNGDTVTVSGLSNSYKLTWTSTTFQFDPPGGVATGGSYCGGYAPAQGSIPVIESITLPESSLSYQFQYDTINGGQTTFGLLQRVTYPDGGYVRYVWGYPQQGYSMEAEGPDSLGHPAACGIQYSMPVVLHRYVSDGTREVLQQDFSYTTDWNSPGDGKPWKTTTVVTTDLQRPGSPAPNFTTVYTYSPYPIPDQPNDLQASGSVNTNVPLEQEIDYSDWTSGGGGLLSKVKKSWQDQFLMTCQSTTQGGTTSRIDYTYTPYGGQITDKKEWDWGASDCSTTASGNLLRETQIVYHTFSGAPLIFDRPDSVTIYGTIDPSTSGEASQTQYTDYDGVGNAGDKIQICLYRCSETGNLTTQYHYYGDGQVQYIIDPNLNRTQYSYACNDAYVTQVIYPSTNGVAHVANFQYGNCASGSLTQSSDENSPPNNTLYDYTDPLGRLKQVTYPDGGQSTYTYNDTPPTPSVEIDRKMDNSGNIFRTVQVMDGLGRVTQTQTGPSTNPVLVDTKYDGSGLAWQVSNPHYNSGSPSDGTTTYAYDALGRPANEGPSNYAVQYPDGSYASTTYSANCSTVADASLRTRILCSDGAGRLTAVTEDPGGLGYATGYTYDALDDLLTVSQSGQGRSFLYDSFSRLTNATNPESGAVSYLYDSNSNVLSKADARGTTRYGYDELNRLLYKNYDPPDTSTVRACYAYDGVSAPPWGGTMNNPVGHLTSSWSVQHDGTVVAANESYQFDPMGRMTAGAQCTPGTCGQTFYSLGAGYNLLGNETGFSDSSSARSTTYDTTDRLLNFSATLPGMQNQNLLTSPQYGPVGMIQASLGNGLTETRGYNNRTWLQSLTVGSVYSLGLAYEGNGNVHSANDSVNGNWSYGYDGVNRLQTASGNGQSFAYNVNPNPWGNMTCSNAGNLPCTPLGLSFNSANNQVTTAGYSYDGAGNLLTDNTHGYVYDAENRIACVVGTDGTCTSATAMLYLYDAQGQRVGKQYANTLEDYVYDPQGHIISTHDGSADLLRTDLYAGSRHVASWAPPNPSYWDPYPAGLFYNHADWLGTERVRTNSSGTIAETCADTPYGMNLACATQPGIADTSPMHFTGKQRDYESNLDNFGARYNESTIGRFMTPDPDEARGDSSDPQSWNMYPYARNNPTTFTDPTGERYQICQTDADGNQTNCADISDQQFGQFEQANKDTLTFTGNGNILQNGTAIGSYQQTSVDATPGLKAVGTGTQMAAPIVKPLFALTMAFIMNVGPATFLDSLVMPVPLGPSMNGKTVPDILQGATPDGGSRADKYSKPGGFPQAQQDFNDLGGGKPETRGPVQVKDLADGRRAVLRSFSSDGRPTLDIQPPGGGYPEIKVRYN